MASRSSCRGVGLAASMNDDRLTHQWPHRTGNGRDDPKFTLNRKPDVIRAEGVPFSNHANDHPGPGRLKLLGSRARLPGPSRRLG
jgi:hypothetical protein